MSGQQDINKEILLKRVDALIAQGEKVLCTKIECYFKYYVDAGLQAGFRSSSLSFIKNLYGETNPIFKDFENGVKDNCPIQTRIGINILKSIKDEIENGWLISFKKLVSAEIFSDFFEMAKHLLDNGYKDAAAVMIGSLLEEHLRLLCKEHSIDIVIKKDGDCVPKKSNRINDELAKSGVYSALDQKSVSAWLAIRNKAAHGEYGEYTKEQVNLIHDGVLDFIRRNT